MWSLLKDMLVPKYLRDIDGDDLILRNYIFTLMNKNMNTFVRIVNMKELVRDIVSEAKNRSSVIAVQPIFEVDAFATPNSENNICVLFCTMFDQLTYQVGEPFLVFV
jgi:hypothetical protein